MKKSAVESMNLAPRCLARTRRGTLCQCPAMKGKRRCYRHGGAPGSGAQRGNSNALKHGLRSRAFVEEMKAIRQFQRDAMGAIE